MSPKTRLADKKEKAGASEKNDSPATKKKSVTEKKKNAGVKRKEAAAKRRAAIKKKRDEAKRSETAEKKRKRDSGLDGESSSNPTKRARNRVRETAASPPEHQGVHSPTPAAELPSQADSEGIPRQVLPSQPQKSPTPTHAASEAQNPQQPRVTSGSSRKSPSHRVDEQNGQEIRSNNRDSNAPKFAVHNDAPRTIVEVTQIEVVSSNGKDTQKITVELHNEKLPRDEFPLELVQAKPLALTNGAGDKKDFLVITSRKTISQLDVESYQKFQIRKGGRN
ncbi:Uncharacterized protein Rs2_35243 [Raphanus sativus]|nr:Uncharacterized protein Rs2_35243 [Raphanus sativus]